MGGKKGVMFLSGQIETAPCANQSSLGLAQLIAGDKGAGMGQNTEPGLWRVIAKKGKDIGVTGVFNPIFGLFAQKLLCRPVRVCGQELVDFTQRSKTCQQIIPINHLCGGWPVTRGQIACHIPPPGPHGMQGAGQRARGDAGVILRRNGCGIAKKHQ